VPGASWQFRSRSTMGKRLLLGLLKGLLIGGAFGAVLHFALHQTQIASGMNWVLYPLVGAVSGGLAGQAPWKPGAWIAGLLKAVFGLAVGAGLFALGNKFLPAMQLFGAPTPASLAHYPLVFAPLLSAVYATLVELDDGGEQPQEQPASGVRVGKISVEDIDVGEDEEAARPAAKSKKN
jgi:hypothetical protein